jgi:hypothetical protein
VRPHESHVRSRHARACVDVVMCAAELARGSAGGGQVLLQADHLPAWHAARKGLSLCLSPLPPHPHPRRHRALRAPPDRVLDAAPRQVSPHPGCVLQRLGSCLGQMDRAMADYQHPQVRLPLQGRAFSAAGFSSRGSGACNCRVRHRRPGDLEIRRSVSRGCL